MVAQLVKASYAIQTPAGPGFESRSFLQLCENRRNFLKLSENSRFTCKNSIPVQCISTGAVPDSKKWKFGNRHQCRIRKKNKIRESAPCVSYDKDANSVISWCRFEALLASVDGGIFKGKNDERGKVATKSNFDLLFLMAGGEVERTAR
jgi:hypothetical protein